MDRKKIKTSKEIITILEKLARKGEILIRESPLLDRGIQVIWNAGSQHRAGKISETLSEAIFLVNQELEKRQKQDENNS